MIDKSFPDRLYEDGFVDLVSVIPPGAHLLPSSKISQASIGKIPGRKHPSGLWAGYRWTDHEPTRDDVRQWVLDGANIGVRTTRFPALDIDVSDAQLAQMIEEAALAQLGPAAVRTGRAPKRLLMYSLAPGAEPFSRMRLWITRDAGLATQQKFLVEFLAEHQQFVAYGTHPSGATYEWAPDPTTVDEAEITREQAAAFFDHIETLLQETGALVEREGDGRRSSRLPAADQQALLAPSIDVLRECVAAIPNDNKTFPSRDAYIRVGYAIKAAAGAANEEDGFEIYAEWAARWDGGVNDPEVVREDWRRMAGAKAVGYAYLAEIARSHGFNDGAYEFEVESDRPKEDDAAILYSDQWLAEQLVARYRGKLRYVPQRASWMVYDGARWKLDAELEAEDLIKKGLASIAARIIRGGGSAKERHAAEQLAKSISTAAKVPAIASLVRSDRAIAVTMDALDHDPWILNTPAGVVDLRTGARTASTADTLATKITSVGPDPEMPMPHWRRFLAEATGGDRGLEAYLQRLAGYCLTGVTHEQHLSFLFGPGGNGKSVFTGTLGAILGDGYSQTATMDTFTASFGEKHSTDVASLVGARLVVANEVDAGKRWDTQRVKGLTGGERVKARFMRQDNFTFTPTFKLIFTGNHQPELRDVDKAMRRRIQMVPFIVTPRQVDQQLSDKLTAEYPAILAWMIDGCLAWQQEGLNPPLLVTAATEEYFTGEDAVGRWISECVESADGEHATSQTLFESWREWANRNNEFVGSLKRLSSALISKGWERWQEGGTRRMGFKNVKVTLQGGTLGLL